MRNIDEVLVGYIRAIIGLDELIRHKAKGDWSKLEILLENDKEARLLNEQMSHYEEEYRESTSLGNVFSFSEELEGVFEALGDVSLKQEDKVSLKFGLEDSRDMIADLTNEDDHRVIALDSLSGLPNFNPDDWVRRKYQFQGIYVPPKMDIPPYIIRMIKEANYSFVYGNFLASAALARSILEQALKERFPEFLNLSLSDITGTSWFKIRKLKEDTKMQNMAENIRKQGNQVMHFLDKTINSKEKRLAYLLTERTTSRILIDLKSLLEFLYA